MEITPITKREAYALARLWAGYDVRFKNTLFYLACSEGGTIEGLAVAEVPTGYLMDDGWTAEADLFIAPELTVNEGAEVFALLGGACALAARDLGYRRVIWSHDGTTLWEGWETVNERPGVPLRKGERDTWRAVQYGR